jgi:heptosyltransferase III
MSSELKNILLKAKSIAVIRTDRLGDMVLTLPLCRALKENFPDAKINMIARSYTKPLLFKSLVIDNYFFIDEFKRGLDDILRLNRFHVVIFPHPRLDEAYAVYKANCPLRIGSGFRLYSFLFNHRVYEHRKNAVKHEAEYNTSLLSSILGKPVETKLVQPYINPESFNSIKEKVKENFLFSEGYFIVHPASGGSAYEWSAENFGKAAKEIAEKTGLQPIITGIQSENEKCLIALEHCPDAFNFCGLLNLNEMIALISKSKILIANSTGILHIAASLDIPVLGLYPNTPHLSQKRWGPYSDKSIVINPPTYNDKKLRDDMSMINIDDVVNSALELINRFFLT